MRHKVLIPLHSDGYDQSTLDLMETAIKQADAEFIWKIFKGNSLEITYEEKPSNIEQVEEDIKTLDRLQYLKLKSEDIEPFVKTEWELSDTKDFKNIISSYIGSKENPLSKETYDKVMDKHSIMFVRMRFNTNGERTEWTRVGVI